MSFFSHVIYIMRDFVVTNLLTKPTSNVDLRKLDNDDDELVEPFEDNIDEPISLVEFSRFYQINGIQIFDVLLIYVTVYYFVYIYLEKSMAFTFLILLVVTIIIVMKNEIK